MNSIGCNTCVCCGAQIPQGRMVCSVCQSEGPNVERGCEPVNEGWKTFVSVALFVLTMIAGFVLAYHAGFENGRVAQNYEDWEINVYMDTNTVQMDTGYGLIWVYDLGEDYFGE